MVAQRMESQGHGNATNNSIRSHNRNPRPNPLGQQGSIRYLTLDEVKKQLLGDSDKPLGSMNLAEFVDGVFWAEGDDHGSTQQIPAPGSSLDRKSSISKKTLDEVWQDIQREQKQSSSLDRNETLGSMSLEDFFVKAGIIAESPQSNRNANEIASRVEPIVISPQPQTQARATQWNANYPQQPTMIPVYVPVSYPENQMTMFPCPSSSPTVVRNNGALSDTQTPRRKRMSPEEIVEKSVQRRQKRMIKNRESAARSRARKQAYTNELENKISCLEEENARLKRQQVKFMEREKVLSTIQPPAEPKRRLRKTNSASF